MSIKSIQQGLGVRHHARKSAVTVAVLLWATAFGLSQSSQAANPGVPSGQAPSYDPLHAPAVQLHVAALNVDLVASRTQASALRSGAVPWAVSWTRPQGARVGVALPEEFLQVRELAMAGTDRVLVIGMASGDVDIASVISLGTGKVLDTFYGSRMAVSPSGRYVAFVHFYPSHGVRGVDQRVRVYDAQRSADQNRPVASRILDSRLESGVPIYPRLPHEAERGETDVPAADAYAVVSPLEWSEDSSRLRFVSTHAGGALQLIDASATGQDVRLASLGGVCLAKCELAHVDLIRHEGAVSHVHLLKLPSAKTAISQQVDIKDAQLQPLQP